MTINDELWEKVKQRMCDDFCYWPVCSSSQESLELHCEKCPLNEIDNPLGYCPEQE